MKGSFLVEERGILSESEEGSSVVISSLLVCEKEGESVIEKGSAVVKGSFLVEERKVFSGSEEGSAVVIRSSCLGERPSSVTEVGSVIEKDLLPVSKRKRWSTAVMEISAVEEGSSEWKLSRLVGKNSPVPVLWKVGFMSFFDSRVV